MRTDGSGMRRVAGQPSIREERVAWPTWSPDGRRLAFGLGQLYVVDVEGKRLRRLAGGVAACCAAWGPGGRKFAVSDVPDTQSAIYVMDVKGGRRIPVKFPDDEHSYWAPTWSPGGQKLAFFSDEAPDMAENSKTSLGVLSRYGGKVRQINVRYPAEPDWSPDGRKIAFDGLSSISPAGVILLGGIRVLDLRSGRVTVLHEGEHPSWSPDSRRLAFQDNHQIFVMNADGSNVKQLTGA